MGLNFFRLERNRVKQEECIFSDAISACHRCLVIKYE